MEHETISRHTWVDNSRPLDRIYLISTSNRLQTALPHASAHPVNAFLRRSGAYDSLLPIALSLSAWGNPTHRRSLFDRPHIHRKTRNSVYNCALCLQQLSYKSYCSELCTNCLEPAFMTSLLRSTSNKSDHFCRRSASSLISVGQLESASQIQNNVVSLDICCTRLHTDREQIAPAYTDFSAPQIDEESRGKSTFMMGGISSSKDVNSRVRFIPLTYNQAEPQTSALRLILTLRPEWENGKIEFIRFTDGITNTLLKIVNRKPGLSAEEIDNEAVLLRAYGQGTDLIIDRERETENHELLMQCNLAPALLARFNNGILYKFIRGAVTSPADLRTEVIWRAVARRLAQWHAEVPCLPRTRHPLAAEIHDSEQFGMPASAPSKKDPALQAAIDNVAPGKPAPNVWTVMQQWIYALPAGSDAEKLRQANLQKELTRVVAELSSRPGLGENSVSAFAK